MSSSESLYLEMGEPPLKAAAMLMRDTGLRVGEALSVEWSDVNMEPARCDTLIPAHDRYAARRNRGRMPLPSCEQ